LRILILALATTLLAVTAPTNVQGGVVSTVTAEELDANLDPKRAS
jgi:hypothetical protein